MSKVTKTKCADCSKQCSTNTLYDDYGEALCRTCFDEYMECPQTGLKLKKSEALAYKDVLYHPSAKDSWKTCSYSQIQAPDLVSVRLLEGGTIYIHESVINDHFFKCHQNNDYHEIADAIECDGYKFSKRGLGAYKNIISNYHNRERPPLKFFSAPHEVVGKRTRFFGVELEAYIPKAHRNGSHKEYANYYAFMADKILNKDERHCIMEWDASVEYGYETIFMPMTKAYMSDYKISRKIWELQKLGLEAFDTRKCGMHIHVSRDSLKPIDWWKVNAIFAKCRRKIATLSGRTQAQLNDWSSLDTEGEFAIKHERMKHTQKRTSSPKSNNEARGSDKYTAINFKNNKTVEFRLFNGTINGDRFMHMVSFVDAVLEFAATHGYSFFINSNGTHIWKEFNTFFKSTYPKAHEYLYQYVEVGVKAGIED